MKFIALDPGSSWMGFAAVSITGRSWRAETRVLDARSRTLVQTVEEVRRHLPCTVIAESYRVRLVGFNRFDSAETPRLLGALEYAVTKEHCDWETIAPGNASNELRYLSIEPYLSIWQRRWPKPSHGNWQHGRSAWRVLVRFMLREHPDKLRDLLLRGRTPIVKIVDRNKSWLPRPHDSHSGDLIAPTARWTT